MNTLPAPQLPTWIEEELSCFDKRYCLEIDGHRMHVMERGTGYPVFMVHGNPTWGFLYRKIAALLPQDRFRCVVPDLIGLGFSDKPRNYSAYTLQNYHKWMGELLQQLDLKECILVGQDWGGPTGILGLLQHKGLMKGMVAANTAIRPPKADFKSTAFHKFSQMPILSDFVFRILGFPQINLKSVQGDKKSMAGKVGKAYRYPLRGIKNNAAPLALARMVPDSHEHPSVPWLQKCEDFVKAFKGPLRLVWGKKDPILGRAGSAISQLAPQAKTTNTGAGHFIQEEEAEKIAQAIEEVFQEIHSKT